LDPSILTIAVATRPASGETVNGDRAQIDWSGNRCRISVIDGLGHGLEAARDAERVAVALSEHPDLSPTDSLIFCDRVLRGQRGAAISVATIDLHAGRLSFAGLGNVEGRFNNGIRSERLITYRGIVGVAMRTLRTFEYSLESDWTLALHTDGVSDRFEDEAMQSSNGNLDEAAHGILMRWGRDRDDATIVLVQPRGNPDTHERAIEMALLK
jgi:serine phosphatase RsbU (regulator of sigma subunit)